MDRLPHSRRNTEATLDIVVETKHVERTSQGNASNLSDGAPECEPGHTQADLSWQSPRRHCCSRKCCPSKALKARDHRHAVEDQELNGGFPKDQAKGRAGKAEEHRFLVRRQLRPLALGGVRDQIEVASAGMWVVVGRARTCDESI